MEELKEAIRKKLYNKEIKLCNEVIEEYIDLLIFRKVKKKELIGQPGIVRTAETFVMKGAFRAFVIDQAGNEQTTQFAVDGWYINDQRSYLTGEPATMYIEALEDSIVADIPKQPFEILCDKYPAMQKLYRVTAQSGFAYAQKRMISNLQKSAEVRYLEFHTEYGHIEQRVPQHALASYLNMSQEYLSKIKSKLKSK